eukprot:7909220-Lingulodinium_polyedra.AAC.1
MHHAQGEDSQSGSQSDQHALRRGRRRPGAQTTMAAQTTALTAARDGAGARRGVRQGMGGN